jgi:hypothetical protein
METINGLPAHILLVHAVVVLVPLSALLLVLVAVWPAARSRLSVLTTVLALVALVAVPLTTEAGEWLERRVPQTESLREHTMLGDGMLPWAIGLFVVSAAVTARQILADRGEKRLLAAGSRGGVASGQANPGGVAATVVLAVLAVAVSVGAVGQVYRIGDSGARAAWTGRFSTEAQVPELRPPGQ